jgi:hypothetical protein
MPGSVPVPCQNPKPAASGSDTSLFEISGSGSDSGSLGISGRGRGRGRGSICAPFKSGKMGRACTTAGGNAMPLVPMGSAFKPSPDLNCDADAAHTGDLPTETNGSTLLPLKTRLRLRPPGVSIIVVGVSAEVLCRRL